MHSYQNLYSVCASLLAVVLTLAAIGSAEAATPTQLIILKRAQILDEHCNALEISKVDFESGIALKVILPDGQTTSVTKTQIGVRFSYPDPSGVLDSPADIQTLTNKRAEALALASKYIKAKPYMDRLVAQIDADVARLNAGQVRYRGVWQNRQSSAGSPGAIADGNTIIIDGTTYQKVNVTRIDNGTVSISHDGGIARIPLVKVTPELFKLIRAKPQLLAGTIPLKELGHGGQKLKEVVLLGQNADLLVLMHNGGVTTAASIDFSKEQLDELGRSNPALGKQLATAAAASANVVNEGATPWLKSEQTASPEELAGEFPGRPRDLQHGFKCTEEETNKWQTLSRIHDYEAFKKLSGMSSTPPHNRLFELHRNSPGDWSLQKVFIVSGIRARLRHYLVTQKKLNGQSINMRTIDLELEEFSQTAEGQAVAEKIVRDYGQIYSVYEKLVKAFDDILLPQPVVRPGTAIVDTEKLLLKINEWIYPLRMHCSDRFEDTSTFLSDGKVYRFGRTIYLSHLLPGEGDKMDETRVLAEFNLASLNDWNQVNIDPEDESRVLLSFPNLSCDVRYYKLVPVNGAEPELRFDLANVLSVKSSSPASAQALRNALLLLLTTANPGF